MVSIAVSTDTLVDEAVDVVPVVAVHSTSTDDIIVDRKMDANLIKYVDVGTQTEDQKDAALEAFENDEVYLSELDIPKSVPNLISLGKIDYPPLTGTVIAKEMTKIVIELDAEFDVVRKNILNLREFLVNSVKLI
ncbi:unnamed protein product [Ambrosiozyma monospora]|uniref:Unnamed protein product n=1 Tax=Ambrosiozyma monospora TaxID=43982 RepID=A0ACB5UA48_AMBMO|nr:unnamed protein product [Ambrosiozyma monospora]